VALATGNYCNPHLTTKFHHVCLEAIPPCYLARFGPPCHLQRSRRHYCVSDLGRTTTLAVVYVQQGLQLARLSTNLLQLRLLCSQHRRKRFRFGGRPSSSAGSTRCFWWLLRMPTMGSSLVVAIVAIAAPRRRSKRVAAQHCLSARTNQDSHAFTGIRQFFPGRNNAT
jgi:hypothetical protein